MIADALVLIAQLAVLFFGIASLVHLCQRFLGESRLRRWMGGRPVVSALKGIAVGFVTPFCTYSAIPMFIGLRRAGVAPAGYVAFIVAAPVLDPALFGALMLIVGIKTALIYLAVTFIAALSLALIAQHMRIERHLKPLTIDVFSKPSQPVMTAPSGNAVECEETACVTSDDRSWHGLRSEAMDATKSALGLMRKLGPVLLLGVSIGLGIELFLPADIVASVTGEGSPLAIPAAAGLGTPLYFNTELFIPIADSLATVGLGVGAVVAFTIAGAGANIPEFVILTRLARPRLLVIFISYVFLVAVVGGYLAQTASS